MPQYTTLTLTPGIWTQITNADVTAITFEFVGFGELLVKGTIGATPPTDDTGAPVYAPGQGEGSRPLSELFPGLTGANRVYVKNRQGTGAVVISHA